MITFGTEVDSDSSGPAFIWIDAKAETYQRVASSRGHPEMAAEIAALNGSRSVTTQLNGKRIRLPGKLDQSGSFNVHCADVAPTVTDGYAMFSTLSRPGRVGVSKFDGYNPIAMDLSLQFEAWDGQIVDVTPNMSEEARRTGYGLVNNVQVFQDGAYIEENIQKLERMAGRGPYKGAAQGPPAIIRISTTQNGTPVPVLPLAYQWTPSNITAPLWRISKITWDNTDQQRDPVGRRVRQKAVVTVTEYTKVLYATRSAAARAKAKANP